MVEIGRDSDRERYSRVAILAKKLCSESPGSAWGSSRYSH